MKDPETKDSYFLKLSGKANIPESLEIGTNYELKLGGTVTSKTESDNNDGSHSIYFKFEPVLVELINEKGKSIKAKDTRGASQIFRSAIWKYWNNRQNLDMDFDTYYQRVMLNLIQSSTDICEMYGG